MATRRHVLHLGAAALAGGLVSARHPRGQTPRRLLLLGGTGFLGPQLVHVALARGWQVAMLNRGRRTPSQHGGDFARVEALRGDRSQPDAYTVLKGRSWDAVIDTATNLQWTRDAVAALGSATGRYVYVSSTGVFWPYRTVEIAEDGPVPLVDTPPQEPPTYGVLKARSEQLVRDGCPSRELVVRPGYIVGPGDTSDRFTYWPVRISRGGTVLAPPADDPVQIIDARDLAEWTIRCCEQQVYGVFNATGPASRFTVRQMLEGIRAATGANATFVHASSEFLAAQQPPVRGWSDLPVWVPPQGETAGFTQRSIARAVAKGLTFRPFADTVKETLAFYAAQSEERKAQLRAGLAADREAAVLAALKARG